MHFVAKKRVLKQFECGFLFKNYEKPNRNHWIVFLWVYICICIGNVGKLGLTSILLASFHPSAHIAALNHPMLCGTFIHAQMVRFKWIQSDLINWMWLYASSFNNSAKMLSTRLAICFWHFYSQKMPQKKGKSKGYG